MMTPAEEWEDRRENAWMDMRQAYLAWRKLVKEYADKGYNSSRNPYEWYVSLEDAG